VLSGGSAALNRIHANEEPHWGRALGLSMLDWSLETGFILVLVWMVRRWPLGLGNWRAAPAYLGAIIAMLAGKYGVYFPLRQHLYRLPASFYSHLVEALFYEALVMALIVGVVHGVESQRLLRAGRLRAAQLEANLTQARLAILRSELQPHFLFNALHSISALMHKNVEAADEMVAQLGDLLRLSLERKHAQEVSLREELSVLEPYLNILRIRFGDRLSIGVDVDPALMEARVPLFILQPLVENAIRHGIERRAGAGRIDIRARAEKDSVRITVTDDGAGIQGNGVMEGIGLSNTRTRLEQLYGPRGTLSLNGHAQPGTEVAVTIPRASP
jgi:LytS/YehU family sensor histidine kinase